jgi:cytochrome b561
MAATTSGYSKLQIALHWLVALLIALQIFGGESMTAAFDGFLENKAVGSFDATLAQVHVYAGITIWLFAAWRLYLRFSRGVPAHPEGQGPALTLLANIIHIWLYGALLVLPVTGSLAWFLGNETFGDWHGFAKLFILPPVFLHIAGGLAQHYYFKTNVLRRMMKAA